MDISEIIKTDIKASLTKSGILLFVAGFMIFMGIITGEMYYTLDFNTRDNYISELGAALPAGTVTPEPSATIFNVTMIVTGIMLLIATFFIQAVFKKLQVTIPLGLVGMGIFGVGIFPGNVAPWHGIFALILFISGGIGAISSYKIVSSPLRYIFICFGIITLVMLIAYKYFIPILGTGGTERWVFYPIVFWITGLGGNLLGIKDEYSRISHA